MRITDFLLDALGKVLQPLSNAFDRRPVMSTAIATIVVSIPFITSDKKKMERQREIIKSRKRIQEQGKEDIGGSKNDGGQAVEQNVDDRLL